MSSIFKTRYPLGVKIGLVMLPFFKFSNSELIDLFKELCLIPPIFPPILELSEIL